MSDSQSPKTVVPDLAWSDGAFRDDRAVLLDAEGRLQGLADKADAAGMPLPGEALLPGFVNAHSHAFQIGLRGHGEVFPRGHGSFWTWREAMYELVSSMTPDRLYSSSRQAFEEMLAAGITSVGEFHYLHHLSEDLDFEGDRVVLEAAHDAGIGIVLLVVYYATGGIGQPLGEAQRRFATPDVKSFWRHIDRLGGQLRSSQQSLGIAPHSIRAVPRDDLRELWVEARRRSLPVHMHVEEQRREIEDCRNAYGATPMEILLTDLAASDGSTAGLEGFTAVHCTHTPADQLARYFAAGGRACICPLTEGNLGDGLPQLTEALAEDPSRIAQVCLGSDSNLRISMLEEMRWLEYGQRVRREERGSIAGDLGRHLVDIATAGGAAALTAGGKPPLATVPVRMPASIARQGTWMYSQGEGSLLPYRAETT